MPPSIAPFLPNPYKLIDDELAAAAKKATLAATAFSAALLAAPYAPTTVGFLSKFFTGFEITPSRGIVVKPAVVVNLLPQPIGVVNPQVYMLPKGMGDLGRIKAIFTTEGGARAYFQQFPDQQDVNDAAQLVRDRDRLSLLSDDEFRAALIEDRRTFLTGAYAAGYDRLLAQELRDRAADRRIAGLAPPPQSVRSAAAAAIDPTDRTLVLRALQVASPGEQTQILAAVSQVPGFLESILTDVPAPLVPVAVDFLALSAARAALIDGSIHPEDIEPTNDAAIRNAAAAKGIRRQLVSERADP